MNTHFIKTAVLLPILAIMAGCEKPEKNNDNNHIQVSEVKITPDATEIVVGNTLQLQAEVLPENAENKEVLWTVSNTDLASVDENGFVTVFNTKGNVSVIAHAGGVEGKCEITIVGIPVSSVALDKTEIRMYKAQTEKLTATVQPEDAENKEVTWVSSNPDIASVDNEGNVTSVAIGETVITATSGNCKAECKVIVEPKPVESVTIQESLELLVGNSIKLTAVVLPEDAEDKSLTWTSSNDNVVTVDSEGTVTAIAIGNADITVKAGTLSDICKVTVVSAKEVALGDYYYSDGSYSSSFDNSKTAVGIIAYLNQDKTIGKIISLDEIEKPLISSDRVYIATYEDYDGKANMQWVKEQENWETSYPAFAWCAAKTEGGLEWYLPAVMETHQICAGISGMQWVESGAGEGQVNNWGTFFAKMPNADTPQCVAARESFISKLTAADATPIQLNKAYFSSTADKGYNRNAWTIQYSNGATSGYAKVDTLPVRAIAEVTFDSVK